MEDKPIIGICKNIAEKLNQDTWLIMADNKEAALTMLINACNEMGKKINITITIHKL